MHERYKKSIIDFLGENTKRTFKVKEISRGIQVGSQDYGDLKRAIRELEHTGEIIRYRKQRFGLPNKLSLITGEIRTTKNGYGFVKDEKTGEDIYIAGHRVKTALDGDLVSVQLLAKTREHTSEGEVIQVLARAHKQVVGVFKKSRNFYFVVPDNPKIFRDVMIPEEGTLDANAGQKVVAEIVKWDSEYLNPEGKVVEILGYPNEKGVDVLSIAKSYQLPYQFPGRVEKETEQFSARIPKTEIEKRVDLREEIIFTIDPVDAKDFDDAVSLTRLENGNSSLGVHIADVSHYVKEGSPLDREAFLRGTSVYLVDRVIPMLPERLSNDLCSLKPKVDRLTYSVFMEINHQGEVLHYRIAKSVIRSKRRFSYEEVQEILDGKPSPYRNLLNEMMQLARILLHKRVKEGSLDFDTEEVRFQLDDQGFPVAIHAKERLDSMRLIEEFMLMANQTVAKHIGRPHERKKLLPFVYRVHEPPDMTKMKKFSDFCKALGYSFPVKGAADSRKFQALLRKVQGKKEANIIEEVAIRSMMKALYSEKNVGHYGLSFDYYTHFTSPIRRYPDLIVHRLLDRYEQDGFPEKDLQTIRKKLPEICRQSNEMERRAMEAERDSVKIKQAEYIAQHLGEEFEGIISGVAPYGLFIALNENLIEGLVNIRNLEDDYYYFDEKNYALIGKRFGKVYRLGDDVTVQVVRASKEEGFIDFILVEDNYSPQSSQRSRR